MFFFRVCYLTKCLFNTVHHSSTPTQVPTQRQASVQRSRLLHCSASKVSPVITYIFTLLYLLCTKSLHFSLSMHNTFASFNFSDFVMYARPASIPSSTHHTLHVSEPLQNLAIHSITCLLSHTKVSSFPLSILVTSHQCT